MRIIYVAGLVVACSIAVASAQGQSKAPRASRPPRQPSRTALLAQLELTESQRGREKAIHSRYAPMITIARRQSRDSAAALHMREITEVRAILTPWQQQKLDAATNLRSTASRGGRGLGPVRIAVPR